MKQYFLIAFLFDCQSKAVCSASSQCAGAQWCVNSACLQPSCTSNKDCPSNEVCTAAFSCVGAQELPAFSVTDVQGDGPQGLLGEGVLLSGTGLDGVVSVTLLSKLGNQMYDLVIKSADAGTLTAALPLVLESVVTSNGFDGTLRVVHAQSGALTSDVRILRGAPGPTGGAGTSGDALECAGAVSLDFSGGSNRFACADASQFRFMLLGVNPDGTLVQPDLNTAFGGTVDDSSIRNLAVTAASGSGAAFFQANDRSAIIASSKGSDAISAYSVDGRGLRGESLTDHGVAGRARANGRFGIIGVNDASGTTTGGGVSGVAGASGVALQGTVDGDVVLRVRDRGIQGRLDSYTRRVSTASVTATTACCAANEILLSGGCQNSTSTARVQGSFPVTSCVEQSGSNSIGSLTGTLNMPNGTTNGWRCDFDASGTVSAFALCLRLPQ